MYLCPRKSEEPYKNETKTLPYHCLSLCARRDSTRNEEDRDLRIHGGEHFLKQVDAHLHTQQLGLWLQHRCEDGDHPGCRQHPHHLHPAPSS